MSAPYLGSVPSRAHERRHGRSPVRVHLATRDRKLAPVEVGPFSGDRHRPVPVGPLMVATYVSIAATCPSSCRFKDAGCYVTSGFTASASRILDDGARGLSGLEVIRQEVDVLDGLFARQWHRVPQDGGRDGRSGRDLRLHVGGDTPSAEAAELLAAMAERWRARGGGRVFTFTHNWRRIPRDAWGSISALASVESWRDAEHARERGYTPAVVVCARAGPRAHRIAPHLLAVPCPAETRGRTCVECRLCLEPGRLEGRAVAFALHGRDRGKVRLPVAAGGPVGQGS